MKLNDLLKLNKFVIIFLIVMLLVILFTIGLTASIIFNNLFDNDDTEKSKPIEISDDIVKSESKPIKDKNGTKEYNMTIIKVEKDYKEDYMYKKNKDYRVIVVHLEIKNKSNKEITVGQFLAKSDNKMLNRNFTLNSSINTLDIIIPNTIFAGTVSFELPKKSKNMTLIHNDLITNDKLDFVIDVNL